MLPVSLIEEAVSATASGGGEGGGGGAGGNSSSTGLVQTLEGGVVTKRSSRIAGLSKREEGWFPSCVRMSD